MTVQVSSEAQRTAEVQARHRREVRQQIILPAVLALLVVIVAPVVALLILFSGRQVGIVASFATMLLLFPMTLVCLLPYALLLAMVAGMSRFNRWTPRHLRRARNAAHGLNMGAHRASIIVTRPMIAVNKRMAWLGSLTTRNSAARSSFKR